MNGRGVERICVRLAHAAVDARLQRRIAYRFSLPIAPWEDGGGNVVCKGWIHAVYAGFAHASQCILTSRDQKDVVGDLCLLR